VNGTSTANYTNYATTDLVNDAVAWITARGSNPWFAWVAFNAPHTPLHLPPTNLCPHYANLPGTQFDINNRPTFYYDAMVEAMDSEIGRLLASINRTNTHIIFLGDNGTPNNTLQPPYPANRGKDSLYEGGVRVPFIISSPDVVNPNRTNDTLVNMVDIFATILEMAGTSVAAAVPGNVPIDGRSLIPTLSNNVVLPRLAYSELFGTNHTANESGRTLRDSRYKLIRYTDAHEEFFDLQTDPYENTNLISSLTATEEAYHDRLEFWLYGYSTNAAPQIASSSWSSGHFSCTMTQAASYALWRCDDLTTMFWSQVTNTFASTNSSSTTLTDLSPPANRAFYSVVK
jgi:arylsulfatase A-like enzyme